MNEIIRVDRSSKGEVVDLLYFKDGVQTVPKQKFTLSTSGKLIIYVYFESDNKWRRLISEGRNFKIQIVSQFLTKDFYKVRELIK